MNLRELLDELLAVHVAEGGELPVLNEEGLDLIAAEYNRDEEPAVLLLFQEPSPEYITLDDITTEREP